MEILWRCSYGTMAQNGGLLSKPISKERKGIKFVEAAAKPYGRLASMDARILVEAGLRPCDLVILRVVGIRAAE